MDWHVLLQAGGAALVAYVLLLGCLACYARRHPQVLSVTDAVHLGPELLRLLRRLVADRTVPARARVMPAALVAYLLLPIDLVPDFLPVIGYADDVILIAVVLRAVIRSAGPEVLDRHWSGSAGGLRALRMLAGLREPEERTADRNTA